MKFRRVIKRTMVLSVAILGSLAAFPAVAWGPVTDTSIVAAATHVLGRDASFSLDEFLRYVSEGASLDEKELLELYPLHNVDPVGAIQREMILLQSLRGDRIDPYNAFRLGALGKLVASATAPLATVDTAVKQRYYADVEGAINGVSLQMETRKLVDPRPYFSRVRSETAEDDRTIIVDYQGGVGFAAYARTALPEDASRSVNAVADVWYTILTANIAVFDEPLAGKREYLERGIKFYLVKGNLREVEGMIEQVQRQRLLDIDMQKRIGDLFFDAGRYTRAIEEYEKVLARKPDSRDVVIRVADYHEMTGDEALKRNDLKGARDAYAAAIEINSLHPDAQRKLLNVEAMIYARDERLMAQRLANEHAREFENRASESVMRRDYARAVDLLREAEARYASVSQEFPVEAKVASLGLRSVTLRVRELKRELIDNSQTLSGSGFGYSAKRLAKETEDVSQSALEAMTQREYRNALQALAEQLDVPGTMP